MAAQLEPKIRSIRSVIEREFQQVAVEHAKTLSTLTDELRLLELGLDSLDLAIVIERLEDALGVDPFTTGEFAESPVTLGDLIRMYERSLSRFA